MKREFIDWPQFEKLVKEGSITDSELKQIQNDIMERGGTTIRNTGGVKKMRSQARAGGKRGGWRIIFADYPKFGVVVLIVAYKKVSHEDLTPEEKKAIRVLKEELDKIINEMYGN